MDICLINPPLDKQTTSKFPMSGVPVGIAQLAGFLREKNVEVSVIDSVIMGYDHERTAKEVERLSPKIVGISCLTENRYAALKTLGEVKKRIPEAILIMGGIHATFTDELMVRNYPFIDMVVRGEGELTLMELIERAKKGRKLHDIKGTSLMKDGKFLRNPDRACITDLDRLPFPAYDMFPMKKYSNPPDLIGDNIRSIPVTSSRGCPMGCKFCATTKYWGRGIRHMSLKKLIEEIEWLSSEYGVNYIRFVDDLFTLDRRRVIKFCDMMLERKIDIGYRIQSRVDTVNDEMLNKLRRIGCDIIEYGAESGSNKILSTMGKNITVDKIKEARKKTKKAGIACKYFLMVGNLGEREEDTYATFRLIKEDKPDWVAVNPLTIYPGTYVYDEAIRKGIVDEDIWLNYVNPKTGNAPMFTEYYNYREMVFLSQLARVWCARNSPHFSEHRGIEKTIATMMNEKLLKRLIFNRKMRKAAAFGGSLLWPLLP
jgi:anaerobic magnesium-protoporphyrin IX monomethyl ester cyclase